MDPIFETNNTPKDKDAELSPGIQALADMADKMGKLDSNNESDKEDFDANGIHKETGTKYDPEGYDVEGFDEIGVDREGFDREGFGSDDRDRDGYDREGYDKNGRDKEGYDREGYDENGRDRRDFDANGINRFTRTKYDYAGYDREGYDEQGYDRQGYDKEGFDRSNFNHENINRVTGTEFGENGWNRNRTVHRDTGNEYDPEGYNYSGRDKDGYDRNGWDSRNWNRDGINKYTNTKTDVRGYDKEGIHEETGTKYNPDGFSREGINKDTGTEYDKDGYNIIGLDKDDRDRDGYKFYEEKYVISLDQLKKHYPFLDERYIKINPINHSVWIQHSAFNRDGVDRDGYGRDGYDQDGYDKGGYDQEGYDREGLDKDGYTKEFNAKFNRYGIDENGYTKNGEMDPDVEFAIAFSESGIRDQNQYAAEKGMDVKDVRSRIEAARRKCPNIDEIVKDVLLTGNKMRVAAISGECEKVVDGKLGIDGFWDKHPKLNADEVLSNFINDPDLKKQFSDKIIENLVLDSNNIEKNLQIFGSSAHDVAGALKGIESFRKAYARMNTDGSPEQIQKKRENMKKIYDAIKYLNKYKNRNLDTLMGSSISFDNEQTWIEFNGETIGQAMDALKKDGKLICVQTVKDYIIEHSKEN